MSELGLLSDHTAKCEKNEAVYVEARTAVERRLQKGLQIRGALDSFELKLAKAVLEFDQELKTIEQNFSQSESPPNSHA